MVDHAAPSSVAGEEEGEGVATGTMRSARAGSASVLALFFCRTEVELGLGMGFIAAWAGESFLCKLCSAFLLDGS
jgi:hypothetical protein